MTASGPDITPDPSTWIDTASAPVYVPPAAGHRSSVMGVVTRTPLEDRTIPRGHVEVGFPADEPTAYAVGQAAAGLSWVGARVQVLLDSTGRVMQISGSDDTPGSSSSVYATGEATRRLLDAFEAARKAQDAARDVQGRAREAAEKAAEATKAAEEARKKAIEAAEKSGFKVDAASIKQLISHRAFIDELVSQEILVAGPGGAVRIADGAVTAEKITASQELYSKLAVFDDTTVLGRLIAENATIPGELIGNEIIGKSIQGSTLALMGSDTTSGAKLGEIRTGTSQETNLPEPTGSGTWTALRYLNGRPITDRHTTWKQNQKSGYLYMEPKWPHDNPPHIAAVCMPILPDHMVPTGQIVRFASRVHSTTRTWITFEVGRPNNNTPQGGAQHQYTRRHTVIVDAGQTVDVEVQPDGSSMPEANKRAWVRVTAIPVGFIPNRTAWAVTISPIIIRTLSGSSLRIHQVNGRPVVELAQGSERAELSPSGVTAVAINGGNQKYKSWGALLTPSRGVIRSDPGGLGAMSTGRWERIRVNKAQTLMQGNCFLYRSQNVFWGVRVQEDGWFRMTSTIVYPNSNTSGRRGLWFARNGDWLAGTDQAGWGRGSELGITAEDVAQLRAGDIIYVAGYQDTGKALTPNSFSLIVERMYGPQEG